MLLGEVQSEGIGRPVPPNWRAGPAHADRRAPRSRPVASGTSRREALARGSAATCDEEHPAGGRASAFRTALGDLAASHSSPGLPPSCCHRRHALATTGPNSRRKRMPRVDAEFTRALKFSHLCGGEQGNCRALLEPGKGNVPASNGWPAMTRIGQLCGDGQVG